MKALFVLAAIGGLAWYVHRRRKGCCSGCAGGGDCAGAATGVDPADPKSEPDGPQAGLFAEAGDIVGDVISYPFELALASARQTGGSCA
jgi:hypothetical protein